MAAYDIQHDIDLIDKLADARAYLAERGVYPDASGQYSDGDIPAIEDAIRSRGWDPTLKREGDEWVVEAMRRDYPDRNPEEISIAPDRVSALVETLQIALIFMTRAEARALFDAEARDMMGISGQEFADRLRAGELAVDDPRVIHIAMLLRTIDY